MALVTLVKHYISAMISFTGFPTVFTGCLRACWGREITEVLTGQPDGSVLILLVSCSLKDLVYLVYES